MSRISQLLFAAIIVCASMMMAISTQSAPQAFTHERFVHMSFNGSMNQVGEFNSQLRREFENQKVPGVTADSRPFLVIHGNPDRSRTLRMDLGFSINVQHNVKAPLKQSKLHYPRVERVNHRGPFTGLSKAHQELIKGKGQVQDVVILHLLSASGNEGDVELIQPLR